jgi:DNA-directed RNA polymerase specialized sigma24 family protein
VSHPRHKPSETPAVAGTPVATPVPASATRAVAKARSEAITLPDDSDDASDASGEPPRASLPAAKYVDDPTLKGDPNDEAESEAGDHALPLDLEEVSAANDTQIPALPDPARERFRLRLNKDRTIFPRLVGYLRGRWEFQEADAKDVAQQALESAFLCKTLPDENRPIYPWLRRYANFRRLRFNTAEGKRKSREELVPDFETHPVEPEQEDDHAEAKARVAKEVAAASAQNAQAYGLMAAQAENDQTLQAAATQKGVNPATAQKQVERFRLDARRRWAQVSAAVVAICALILLFIHFRKPDDTHEVVTHPYLSPPEIRKEALKECADSRYKACLADLDLAKRDDPKGRERRRRLHSIRHPNRGPRGQGEAKRSIMLASWRVSISARRLGHRAGRRHAPIGTRFGRRFPDRQASARPTLAVFVSPVSRSEDIAGGRDLDAHGDDPPPRRAASRIPGQPAIRTSQKANRT